MKNRQNYRSILTHLRTFPPLAMVVMMAIICACCKNRTPGSGIAERAEAPATRDSSRALRTVRVLPYWVPSAQFAGYYVGIEKGIFNKHGINLEILPFNPIAQPADILRANGTDFAILWLVNAIELKAGGADIVNIAQLSSRSSLMLITKKSSGINKIEDMNGKRAGIWIGYERQPEALFKKYHLKVDVIPIGSTNNLFLQGGVDILNANWFDEYHSILNNGINEDELNKFFFADYGFNFLEDGIYCSSKMVSEDPRLCVDFVNATLESWQYAFDHQKEALGIVVKYATALNQPVNLSHQQWMLSHFRQLYIPEGKTAINTELRQTDFDHVQQIMLESKFIDQATPFESFYHAYTALPIQHQ